MLSFLGLKGRSVSTGVILAAFAIVPGAAARGFVHPVAWAAAPVPVGAPALAQLSVPGGGLSPALRAARARLVSPALNIWRIAAPASGVISALRAEGVLAGAEPDRRLVPFTHLNSGDPLLPSEWWIRDVGDDQAEPPPAGVPVTVVDTGLDLAHPEFKPEFRPEL